MSASRRARRKEERERQSKLTSREKFMEYVEKTYRENPGAIITFSGKLFW